MKKATAISCAFLDIGGVLLIDGWDQLVRKTDPQTLGRKESSERKVFTNVIVSLDRKSGPETGCPVANPSSE